MASETLDTISVKEKYEASNGKEKTRTTTIKAMDNNGSLFINIHSGRGSVCVSKDMVEKVAKAMNGVSWKKKATKAKDNKIASLEKQLNDLKKELKKK